MTRYEEKKAERIERMEARADAARAAASASFGRAHSIAEMIPPGQPILVGHHSEKRHRRDLARIDNGMRAASDALKKAEYWENRARAAAANTAISSDDPEALRKLGEKLEYLQTRQERMKAVNAAHAKYQKNPASLDVAELTEAEKDAIRSYEPRYSWEPHPYAPWQLSNNNGVISNVKKRIATLEAFAKSAEQAPAEREIGEVRIVENAEINRCQVIFPDKPAESVRAMLKSGGFRWSPTEGAWQRQRSNAATYHAERAAALYAQTA